MRLTVLSFTIALIFSTASGQFGSRLETYNVDRTQMSVGGISSGAYMATQFHVAYSSKMMGVGMIEGGPYFCAEGQLNDIERCFLRPEEILVSVLVSSTLGFESADEIDPTTNLINDKVWILNGALDTVVVPETAYKAAEYYEIFVNPANIFVRTDLPAQHGQPTMDRGGPCDTINEEDAFLNSCQYEAAFEMLNYIYGGELRRPNQYNDTLKGELIMFDVTEFFELPMIPANVSMDSIGYIYVPESCANKTIPCKLHVSFHGCNSGSYINGDYLPLNLGYSQVGEYNNIIIIYPQVVPTDGNPSGCWDWWGYSDPADNSNLGLYAKRQGGQLLAVSKIVDRVSGAETTGNNEDI